MKHLLLFIILMTLILVSALEAWWLLLLLSTVYFSLLFPTYSLLLVGLLLDGYFNQFESLPFFSLLGLCWVLLVESIRDQLIVRETR